MRLSLPLHAIVAGALMAAGCHTGDTDPVLLELGDQRLRRSEFDRYVQRIETRGGPVAPEVRKALLLPYLEERVLVLEARERGLLPSGAAPEEEQRAVAGLLAREAPPPPVTDQEVAAYFQAHLDSFKRSETITVSQILVPTAQEAAELKKRLQKTPAAFETLAREVSRGPESVEGGHMGTFSRGELPVELETAAFALAPQSLSDVIATPLGFHILRIDSRSAAREEGLDEAQVQIRSTLSREKSADAVRRYVQGLMTRAKVRIDA
jgi:peptidyl-prolyl cis-trans isomerase C